ncbi:acyl transferase [Marivirga sp. S37H4]|uniref:Acyl transferase n=1 Tax=Marivirga aurantiaca TaxID=2802615 RepID=A0A935C5L0_9BACT|nr:acyl transferase [Marivirga aurantiaca]MBK6263921.1 acyl transferase [Marivirga aurantiaca]
MSERERFFKQIDTVTKENFSKLAFSLFQFQYTNNPIYKKYVDFRGLHPDNVNSIEKIPFLPIEFFKNHQIITQLDPNDAFEAIFESSGTGSIDQISKHYVKDFNFYLSHSLKLFESLYGSVNDYIILALLPSYLERANSSLVAMVDYFIKQTASVDSGFYLYDQESLLKKVDDLKKSGSEKKIIIWGVSFALLDLAEEFTPDFSDCIVMETGGMKGRRKEMIREAMHDFLCERLNVKKIHSEYGMTELLSQSYSKGDGIFQPSQTMKILVREVNDPFEITTESLRSGGINIIDLANIDSCSFIETKDVGSVNVDGSFSVYGRFDHSDIRGCNLLVG